jgi:ABC-type antimicrobial peptide transport system permease subunit
MATAVLVSGSLLDGMLFGVSARDPWSLAAGALLVLLATGVACASPALRAGRMDPVRALRAE